MFLHSPRVFHLRHGLFLAIIPLTTTNLMKIRLIAIQKLKVPLKAQRKETWVFLDLADNDMRQINALFYEVIKSKIKACKLKEEGEALKFNEKHIINKIYTVCRNQNPCCSGKPGNYD
ncbi:hypothetical protein L2E82_34235 [Cichorium intybus]|uniref:Uncharacterized protein n=1 Tax=Cichorium intybus TaxID=13427 RepID=A0ACB9BLS1_CICIN|nr:hypothetical protein L2E82_34235 [Cichorium intybus]